MLAGNGDGTFTALASDGMDEPYDQPESIVVGDFNGDGILDLAILLNGAGGNAASSRSCSAMGMERSQQPEHLLSRNLEQTTLQPQT